VANHFQSAHYASAHFLSYHFSGGTVQVIVAEVPYPDVGADGGELLRLPNGAIIAIAVGALLIMEDDLDY
jgi:hypothetical protein